MTAGSVQEWVAVTLAAQRSKGRDVGVDVPCGTCTACCRSSYFVHVEPDETETLRRIPREVLFAAPGRPKGHLVMGFDEWGRCPMLTDRGCSIYEHRPRTCRTYDCRVFAATDVSPDADGKPDIAARVREWRFDPTTPQDAIVLEALRAAAAYLQHHPDVFDPDGPPSSAGRLGLLAVGIHAAFLSTDGSTLVEPEIGDVRRLVQAGPDGV